MTNIWTAEERSARMLFRFDDGSFYEQPSHQYLDPYSQKAPEFSLYYFIKDQTFDNKVKPTILFAAGGPGQMILPDTTNFVDMFGYRVVISTFAEPASVKSLTVWTLTNSYEHGT